MSRSGLEFLGMLAGGLVHEIKNPLSTLRINLTLLKEDLPEQARRIEVLEKEVARLDAILTDFMRYAGVRKPDLRPADLKTLLEEILEFAGPGFSRDGVAIEASLDPVEAEVDGPLLKQAVLNLLLNAQQAGSGTVRVALRDGPVIEIADDGCGIDDLERVFDVYYSGSKKGSGLGLPTARRIVEEHGGTLTLSSKPGEGTRVTVAL